MRKYAVLTDSACDLPESIAKEHGVDILCFKIALDGKGYTEWVDFTPEAFCDMLRDCTGMPTTSQVTQFEFEEQFEKYDAEGVEQVLYISICGSGSGTNAAAQRAALQFREDHPESRMTIDIVDSWSYSLGYGMAAVSAADRLAAGEPMAQIVADLNALFRRREVLLAAYTLKIIRKSGRISAASAIAGELLGIHPVFSLNDGVSSVIKKVRGEKGVVTAMAQQLKARIQPGTPYYVAVADHKYEQEYTEACTKAVGYPPAVIAHLGCAVCSNTGPEAVGIIFEGAERPLPE